MFSTGQVHERSGLCRLKIIGRASAHQGWRCNLSQDFAEQMSWIPLPSHHAEVDKPTSIKTNGVVEDYCGHQTPPNSLKTHSTALQISGCNSSLSPLWRYSLQPMSLRRTLMTLTMTTSHRNAAWSAATLLKFLTPVIAHLTTTALS
jgi:hypothetical protein